MFRFCSAFRLCPGFCVIVFGGCESLCEEAGVKGLVFRFCCSCGLFPGLCVIVLVGCEALCEEVGA